MATVEVSAPKDGAPVTSDPEPSPAPASAQPSPPRPATVREDQVANAVAFLTNPKVASATTEAKTTFLVKKGLTSEEIDEAFRRAPQAPTVTSYAPAASPPVHASAGATAAPTGSAPYAPPSQPGQQAVFGVQPAYQQQLVPRPPQQLQAPPPPQRQTSWSAILLGLTAVAAGAYGLQRLVAPYAKEYYERWALSVAAHKRGADGGSSAVTAGLAEGTTGSGSSGKLTAKEQASAATLADAIKAQTEELRATMAELKEVLSASGQVKGSPARKATALEGDDDEDEDEQSVAGMTPASMAALRSELRADVREDLRAELRSFALTISELAGGGEGGGATPATSTYGTPQRGTPGASPLGGGGGGGKSEFDHAGDGARNLFGNGTASSPDGQGYNANYAGGYEEYGGHPLPGTKSGGSSVAGEAAAAAPGVPGRKPAAMAEVLAMMERGVTPTNVRSDIRDAPPDPAAAPSASRLAPRPKPWERAAGHSAAANGSVGWAAHHQHRSPSVAFSLNDDIAGAPTEGAEAPWKPPAVPQPSVPLPRRRAASSTPPPHQPPPPAPNAPPPQQAASTTEAPPTFATARNDSPAQPSEEFPPLPGTHSKSHRATHWSDESAPQSIPTPVSEQPQEGVPNATEQASSQRGLAKGDESYAAALVADQPTDSAGSEASHPTSVANEITPAGDRHRDESSAEA